MVNQGWCHPRTLLSGFESTPGQSCITQCPLCQLSPDETNSFVNINPRELHRLMVQVKRLSIIKRMSLWIWSRYWCGRGTCEKEKEIFCQQSNSEIKTCIPSLMSRLIKQMNLKCSSSSRRKIHHHGPLVSTTAVKIRAAVCNIF